MFLRPRIGISSCLLGEAVRYDGDHKRSSYLVDTLGPHVEWVPVCPEVEVGMSVPREPVALVAGERTRMIGRETGRDWTDELTAWAAARLDQLEGLCGYVFKRGSPSCGLVELPLEGPALTTGRGLFAQALIQAHPHLPVEEEGRLESRSVIRRRFVERVFAWARLEGVDQDVERLHRALRYQLEAHTPGSYKELEGLTRQPRRFLRAARAALGRPATTEGELAVARIIADQFIKRMGYSDVYDMEAALWGVQNDISQLDRLRGWLRDLSSRRQRLSRETWLTPYPEQAV